jgi:hypothetical protein
MLLLLLLMWLAWRACHAAAAANVGDTHWDACVSCYAVGLAWVYLVPKWHAHCWELLLLVQLLLLLLLLACLRCCCCCFVCCRSTKHLQSPSVKHHTEA